MKKQFRWHALFPGYWIGASKGTIGLLSHPKGQIYVIQVSAKDPWKRPHKEMDYLGTKGSWLAGWLFFYVGVLKCRQEGL